MNTSPSRVWIVLALCVFSLVLVRTAWICDDAYISYRVVDNFVHGRGLVWNVGERVQAHTNPLWTFLMCIPYFITREMYLTMLLSSMAVSMVAVLLVAFRASASAYGAVLALGVLTVSRAFVDYSTSGLENPLTHLFLVLFAVRFLRDEPRDTRALRNLALIVALSMINRMDSVLLFAPALLVAAWSRPWKPRITALLIGFTPFLVWEVFSILYYGFPFPNTAYAKLGTGVPRSEVLTQGFIYLIDSLKADPVTLFVIVWGVALAVISHSRRQIALAGGAVLYLVYTVHIGGDFMSGRFLAAPLFVAALLLARQRQFALGTPALAALSLVVILGFAGRTPNLLSGIEASEYVEMVGPKTGIVDERRYYYLGTGLLCSRRGEELPFLTFRNLGLMERLGEGHVRTTANIGFRGFFAGPEYHFVDTNGLSDPLLARMPAHFAPGWRIGHHGRFVPKGYVQTLEDGEDAFEDRDLARYYEQLSLITTGDLFSLSRLKAIVRMNLGWYDDLIDTEFYRFAGMANITLKQLNQPPENRTVSVPLLGLRVDLGELRHEKGVDVMLRGENQYIFLFVKDGEVLAQELIYFLRRKKPQTRGILQIPASAYEPGYDEIRVFGGPRRRGHEIGSMKFVEE